MKVVILAGGYGTRLSEETDKKPKPMTEIGGKPILWHIMKIYSSYGYNDFIICCGYKGYIIKEYFLNYYNHQSDFTIDLSNGNIDIHNKNSENWKITLVDTGLDTMTGGRIKRVKEYIRNETFMLTYGDGVSDVNINELVKHHKLNKKLATVTAVQPSGRYGLLNIDSYGNVNKFVEKPKGDGGWINGGFFVLEPQVIDYIENDEIMWEQDPLINLAKDGELSAYIHDGFWKPMDTLRDKLELEKDWNEGIAKWKIW